MAGGHGWKHWGVRVAVGLLAVLVVAVVVFLVATRNPEPDDFYSPPDDLSQPAGTILRSEEFHDGVPAGVDAWKVLYVSSDPEGEPVAVSGLVMAAQERGEGPHPVLAWAHGTTGIAPACAPSNSAKPLEGIPDLTGALEQGWVITMTDYPGLGTPGPHPYLVGESEGRAVLDSVLAAHQLDTGIELDDRYAIWGHSQGGHAALFAGQLAEEHLPDQELVGVVALAPATDLLANLQAVEGTREGNVLAIFAAESWTDYYDDIPDGSLTERAQRPADRLAETCLNQPSRFRTIVVGLTLPKTVLAVDPATDPAWKGHLADNVPHPAAIEPPVLVVQGLADEIVAPKVTEVWAIERCAAERPTRWVTYPGVTHTEVVVRGGNEALGWTIERFAGGEPPDTCPPVP